MNDLPIPSGNPPAPITSGPAGGSININDPMIQPGISAGVNKEMESGRAELPFRPSGIESELPPEVASSGVKIQPATIPIPAPVVQMGVKPAGQNVPAAAPAIALPLSDDQIALGLKQSVWSSWRWLAEWCVRKIKQVHMGLKNVHENLINVRQ